MYLSGCENAVWVKKKGSPFNAHCKSNVLTFPCGRSKLHPTEKNHQLITDLILDNSNENDIIFDPCCGSGSHCLMAKENNRRFLGIELDTIKKLLSNFKNAERRFQEEKVGNSIIIDDYAHHPTEIKVSLEAAKAKYPEKDIVAIFKPNTYSRTKEFTDDFATALSITSVCSCLLNKRIQAITTPISTTPAIIPINNFFFIGSLSCQHLSLSYPKPFQLSSEKTGPEGPACETDSGSCVCCFALLLACFAGGMLRYSLFDRDF